MQRLSCSARIFICIAIGRSCVSSEFLHPFSRDERPRTEAHGLLSAFLLKHKRRASSFIRVVTFYLEVAILSTVSTN